MTEDERASALADLDPWIVSAVLAEANLVEVLRTRVDPSLRRLAVALAAASDDLAVRASAGALAARDPDPWLRARSAELLDAEALPVLLELTRDADLGVRAAAADVLGRRPNAERDVERLLDRADTADAQRAAAYCFLLRGFDDAARARLDEALTRGEPAVVHAQLHAIALAFGDEPAAITPTREHRAPSEPLAPEPALASVARRVLGQTGIEVAPLGLSGVHELEPSALVDARRAGVNLFFWEPRHEKLTRFLRHGRAHRDDLVIVAGTYHADAASIERDVATALRRLRTDRIDLFLLFWTRSPARLGGATSACLERLKRRGDLRAIGFSTHDRVLAEAALRDGPWDALMIRHSAAHPGAERSLFGAARAAGVGVLTFSNLCYGRLLRTRPGRDAAERPPSAADCYRYSLAQPGVTACISAPRRPRELAENLAVLASPAISSERVASLRAHGLWVHEESARWNALVRRADRVAPHVSPDASREDTLALLDAALEEPRLDA